MRTVVCPRCKQKFVCQHNATCFCANYRITQELSDKLRQMYNDCLCEECLKEYSVGNK